MSESSRLFQAERASTVSSDDTKPEHKDDRQHAIDESRRKLLKQMEKSLYTAPIALAMMSTKASACSLTC
jgi:hypothetical protein